MNDPRKDEQRRREAAHTEPYDVLPEGHAIAPRAIPIGAIDDPTEWADEALPRPRSTKRPRAAMLSLRLTADELEAIERAASFYDVTISQYVRDAALKNVHLLVKLTA